MGCSCGLNGSLIIDVGSTSERRSSPQRSQGPNALCSIEVLEVDAADPLLVSIMHKKDTDTSYTEAGAFSNITSAGVHTLHVTGLKAQYYWRYRCADGKYIINAPTVQTLR